MKKAVLISFTLCLLAISSYAQLTYNANGTLTLGNVSPYGIYRTNFEGYGFYFTRLANSTFLEFCLGASSPRIAGAGDQIVFYNTETGTYNSIQVASVYNYSDSNAKTNIQPISYGLQTVLSLKPVTYNWKNSHNGLKNLATGTTPSNIGFISQDVQQVLPQLVYTDAQGHKLLNYTGIIPILTRSIQELSAEVDSLKAQVAKLKGK